MKKKSFGLAAAVAVLIVLGGSYALLANHNRIQESESAAAESETGVAVATIASDKVSSFQLADGDTSFTLTKTDNSWICVQDETFPLSNDAASELVNTFTSLQAVRDLGTGWGKLWIFGKRSYGHAHFFRQYKLQLCSWRSQQHDR